MSKRIKRRPSLQELLEASAEFYGFSPYALTGRSRIPAIVEARHAYCMLGVYYGYTEKEVAGPINRDRSSIGGAVRKFRDTMDVDTKWRGRYVVLFSKFDGRTPNQGES